VQVEHGHVQKAVGFVQLFEGEVSQQDSADDEERVNTYEAIK